MIDNSQIRIAVHTAGLQLQKYAPQIMTATGVTGVLLSTFYACKESMKLQDILESFQHADTKIDEAITGGMEEQTPEDIRVAIEAKRKNMLWFAKELASLYGVPAATMLASLSLLVGSNVILWRRNAALSAAFTMVSTAYEMYRNRVREEFGEEVDHHIRYEKPFEKPVKVVYKDGEEVEYGDLETADSDYRDEIITGSPYAVYFDETSPQWRSDPLHNEYFLKAQERYANDKLNANGHVFLNEVYDSLGIKRSKAGNLVGWVKNGPGDGFIDFDIYNARNAVDGVMVTEGHGLYLDFNVDGLIWDLI